MFPLTCWCQRKHVIPECRPAHHRTTQHKATAVPYVRVSVRQRHRERESLCVFTDVSKRVDCSDGCRGPGEVGGSERVCCACVIDVSWLMVGLYMKIFLFRVMGERPNSGHPWLSATLSFVITHLQVLVEECVCLSECGLTPVGNRVSRLILPLPTPVDRVNRARWETQISSEVIHQQSPHCMDGPHAFYSSETCKL